MISEAIDKILGLADPVELVVDDRTYFSKPIHAIKEPEPVSLMISTLTGLRDYYQKNPDCLDLSTLIFRVASHEQVDLCGPLFGEFEQRKCYAIAKYNGDQFPFERFMEPEKFIIRLQAMFQQDDTTAKIMSIVGNIKDERVSTIGDDGITQQVTARAGIARVENIVLPNPVTLTPFRTFLEATQPTSQFVFRMRSGAAETPATCALFEADGGRWKLDAIENIKHWMVDNIGEDIQVLA